MTKPTLDEEPSHVMRIGLGMLDNRPKDQKRCSDILQTSTPDIRFGIQDRPGEVFRIDGFKCFERE